MTPDERDEYPKRSLKGEQATDANNKIKLTFQIPSVISQSRFKYEKPISEALPQSLYLRIKVPIS